jgi:hypothetical protein
VLVLNGDATDLKILQEEGIHAMDGVIVVTADAMLRYFRRGQMLSMSPPPAQRR